ncbi:hypothetical protein DFH06DRAFT_1470118 [Mycena polygramma]|nr:hypothetical protein DFH06DRAFT_1470118 [Mycena polygramma]
MAPALTLHTVLVPPSLAMLRGTPCIGATPRKRCPRSPRVSHISAIFRTGDAVQSGRARCVVAHSLSLDSARPPHTRAGPDAAPPPPGRVVAPMHPVKTPEAAVIAVLVSLAHNQEAETPAATTRSLGIVHRRRFSANTLKTRAVVCANTGCRVRVPPPLLALARPSPSAARLRVPVVTHSAVPPPFPACDSITRCAGLLCGAVLRGTPAGLLVGTACTEPFHEVRACECWGNSLRRCPARPCRIECVHAPTAGNNGTERSHTIRAGIASTSSLQRCSARPCCGMHRDDILRPALLAPLPQNLARPPPCTSVNRRGYGAAPSAFPVRTGDLIAEARCIVLAFEVSFAFSLLV